MAFPDMIPPSGWQVSKPTPAKPIKPRKIPSADQPKKPKSVEVADIIAWKVVAVWDGALYPPVQGRKNGSPWNVTNGEFIGPTYSLWGINHFADLAHQDSQKTPMGVIRNAKVATRKHRTNPRLTIKKSYYDYKLGKLMTGFHCYKSLHHLLMDEWKKKEFDEGLLIIAKVRLWGTLIQATKGYQSEYMEIVELYSSTNNTTRRAIAHRIGWPFHILDVKMEPQWSSARKKRTKVKRPKKVN